MWPSSASSFARERNEYGKEPTNSDGALHVPPFAKPLTPFIKTRQEALRIRQALTLYLRSQIIFTEDDSTSANCHAHLSLCVPRDAVVGVKRIPLELSGLRREYLKALQENVAAMQGYKAISDDVASGMMVFEAKANSADVAREGQENNGSSAVLQEYIAFLRDRRLYEKLQVFQHYLNKLSERGGSLLEDVTSTGGDQHERLRTQGIDENTTKAEDDLEELVFTLEKAVIRAKIQLDREKELLKGLRAQWESSDETRNGYVSSAIRITALQRTRDELVRWVEEKLVASGGDDDGPLLQDIPQDDGHDSVSLIEERKRQIKEQYDAYIKARKSLLEAISAALQPTTNGGRTVPSPSLSGVSRQRVAASSGSKLGDALLYSSEVLHPLTKVQRTLALQKSYLSGLLVKEKLTTCRILDRLSSESHLLPEYPLLARQPRFKHIATVIGSRSRQPSEQHKADEIVSHAQAWAFASDAARMNEREYVEQKAGLGREMADHAYETLKEVYEILNQNLDEVIRDKDEEHDSQDIWAADLRLTRYRGRQPRGERRVKGPWSGLNGRVGIQGDI
jgi:hypothetical protein